jgi:predicted enzyme related to lactoylglutathione lyase
VSSTHGKICYIEIPTTDIERSSQFYSSVFGGKLRKRGDGRIAFDDGVGGVSGTWVTGRTPMVAPGPLVYIMVDNAADIVQSLKKHGAEIVQEIGGDAPEITARFRDPGGNVLGIYQEPSSPR